MLAGHLEREKHHQEHDAINLKKLFLDRLCVHVQKDPRDSEFGWDVKLHFIPMGYWAAWYTFKRVYMKTNVDLYQTLDAVIEKWQHNPCGRERGVYNSELFSAVYVQTVPSRALPNAIFSLRLWTLLSHAEWSLAGFPIEGVWTMRWWFLHYTRVWTERTLLLMEWSYSVSSV